MNRPLPKFDRPTVGRNRRGFSFTEILFAVMILGIGFIMVAAMFPVAIHQTEDSSRETIAASVARSGYSYFNEVASTKVIWPFGPLPVSYTSVLVPTTAVSASAPYWGSTNIPAGQSSVTKYGQVWSFSDARDGYGSVGVGTPPAGTSHKALLWAMISKNMIQATDPRYAWTALYRRDVVAQGAPGATGVAYVPANFAQIIVIGVQSRAKPAYDPTVDATLATSPLLPQLVTKVAVSAGSAAPLPTINFKASPGMVAENAYVVISNDNATGAYNGRIYRIGNPVPPVPSTGAVTWYFAPGQGPGATDPALNDASVFVVGRGADPATAGSYAGAAQDISVYTTFVQTP